MTKARKISSRIIGIDVFLLLLLLLFTVKCQEQEKKYSIKTHTHTHTHMHTTLSLFKFLNVVSFDSNQKESFQKLAENQVQILYKSQDLKDYSNNPTKSKH